MIVDSASLVQNLLRREKQTSVSLSHDKTNNLSSFLERTNNMLRVGDKVVYLQAENEPSYGIIKKIHSPNGHWEAEVAFVSTLLNIIKQRCHMLAFRADVSVWSQMSAFAAQFQRNVSVQHLFRSQF